MSETRPNKLAVIAALDAVLAAELRAVESVASMARDEATSSETKAEGKYDTRATEASYLARGQAWRVAELRRQVAWLRIFDFSNDSDGTVCTGSLVQIQGDRISNFFVGPIGGLRAEADGHRVQVVSPSSPLGQAMMGLTEGEDFEVRSPRGSIAYEILSVE